MPLAPGTFGSIFGLIIVFLLSFLSWPFYFAIALIYCAFCLWIISLYLESSVSKEPREVVCDEVMGVLITFFLVPISGLNLCFGFLLFRLLDILKPPPISFFDRRVPGATGVMADDIVAGLIVNMIFHFIILPLGIMERFQSFYPF